MRFPSQAEGIPCPRPEVGLGRLLSVLSFSAAAARNQRAICQALEKLLADGPTNVLEVGSGTGQHAIFFTDHLPGLKWQTSDLAANVPELQARIQQDGRGRLPKAIELDVLGKDWPAGPFDIIFTANTLHIMPWSHTPVLLRRSAECLESGGRLIIYGPFHYSGLHTAPSNASFDQSLKLTDQAMGVRDAIELTALAAARGLRAEADLALPANNRLLVFCKV